MYRGKGYHFLLVGDEFPLKKGRILLANCSFVSEGNEYPDLGTTGTHMTAACRGGFVNSIGSCVCGLG